MNDAEEILKALRDHRTETRADMHELRGAVVKIADAASEMGKTMARSEERHAQHDDANRRISEALSDHEARLRSVEADHPTQEGQNRHTREISDIKAQLLSGKSSVSGGWKVLTVIGAIFLGLIAVISAFVRLGP